MQKRNLALILSAVTAVPATHALTAHAAGVGPKARAATKPQKFKGPAEDMRWGTVRVTISVKNKKITGVSAIAPEERSRSLFINQQALPMLKQEVLQAQNATIDAVSGATMTSEAYITSLKGAIKSAKKHKALK
jgi:uncharacterized protein with FMN-binding domain